MDVNGIMTNKTDTNNFAVNITKDGSFGKSVNKSDVYTTGYSIDVYTNFTLALDEQLKLLKQPPLVTAVLILLYTAVFLVAISNNCLIITVICK